MEGEWCECHSSFSLRWRRPAVLRVRSSKGRLFLPLCPIGWVQQGGKNREKAALDPDVTSARAEEIRLMHSPQAYQTTALPRLATSRRAANLQAV